MRDFENDAVETLEFAHGVQAHILPDHDNDSCNPRENDNFGKMVCFHRRYNLGDKKDHKEPDDFLVSLLWDAEPAALRPLVKHLIKTNKYSKEDFRRSMKGVPADQQQGMWHDYVVTQLNSGMTKEDRTALFATFDRMGIVMLPLYLYDHSGITISTGDFGDRWDSGQIGWIYATLKDTLDNWSVKSLDDPVDYHDGNPPKTVRERAVDLLKAEVKEYDLFLTGQVYGFVIQTPDEENADSCWGFLGMDCVKEDATSSANHYVKKYADPARMAGAGI
jgi:hypothetical protein